MDKSEIRQRTNNLLEKVDRPKEFTEGVKELLQACVDKEATKNYQRIIPDTGKFYGVPKPTLWIIAGEMRKFIQKEPTKAENLLRIMWEEGSFEMKQITGKSLEKYGPKHPNSCLDFVSSILTDLDNWSVCDSLAMYGVEPIVYSHPERVLPLSETWTKNSNKWIRRFGVVTLRGYKKIKTTDDVFKILNTIMADNDRDVRKSVAWILREITKRNPTEVGDFLVKWGKTQLDKDTQWIIKNGMKKLPKKKQHKILSLLD